ncbi:Hypp1621 [Branchiostoma lanceolatum]|uniref:Hypp1621 protein n=1 Tax=Branchiostoma lanceolatum TaxID=7740 RepID=A0A8J9ZLF5_BRALA|nr:Hypp1621 [Branchiostoma lanceolatum]
MPREAGGLSGGLARSPRLWGGSRPREFVRTGRRSGARSLRDGIKLLTVVPGSAPGVRPACGGQKGADVCFTGFWVPVGLWLDRGVTRSTGGTGRLGHGADYSKPDRRGWYGLASALPAACPRRANMRSSMPRTDGTVTASRQKCFLIRGPDQTTDGRTDLSRRTDGPQCFPLFTPGTNRRTILESTVDVKPNMPHKDRRESADSAARAPLRASTARRERRQRGESAMRAVTSAMVLNMLKTFAVRAPRMAIQKRAPRERGASAVSAVRAPRERGERRESAQGGIKGPQRALKDRSKRSMRIEWS